MSLYRSLPLVLAFALWGCAPEEAGGPATTPVSVPAGPTAEESAQTLRADSRISELIFPCSRDAYFGEDTSNLIPALLQKLETGQKDPLIRAQITLASMGQAVIPGLQSMTDRLIAAPEYKARLHNVLGVVARMDPPLGREVALRLIDDPLESLRLSALQALDRRVMAEDYDRLMLILPKSSQVLAGVIVKVLARADADRLSHDLSSWISEGSLTTVWESAAVALQEFPPTESAADGLWGAAQGAQERTGLPLRVRLLAIAVSSGSEEISALALSELTERSAAEDATERSLAFDGLRLAGRPDLLLPRLAEEEDGRLRELAVGILMEWDPTVLREEAALDRIEMLRRTLRDEKAEVRKISLKALVAELDRAAIDIALTALDGSREELEQAVDALHAAAEKDSDIAEIARDVLEERLNRPEAERDLRMIAQALGRLPCESAARTLLARARTEPQTIATMRAHRFLTLQIANVGEAGVPVLIEALQIETDPLRRLDLLETLSTSKSERATEVLLGILHKQEGAEGAAADLEALYVARRLLGTRPATLLAPVLKRTALRMEVGEARRALQCLLWRYFGSEN